MTIRFQCSHCSHKLRATDAEAGRRAKCTRCGTVVRIPGRRVQTSAGSKPADPDGEPVLIRRRMTFNDELDMTAMADVTFLLLIFFMITASFSLQKAIEVPPVEPEKTNPPATMQQFEEDERYVIVRVDGDNRFWVSGSLLDEERQAPSEFELLSQLRKAGRGATGGQSRGASRLLVLASGDARHEYVVKALDAGSTVGMEEVKLATLEDGE